MKKENFSLYYDSGGLSNARVILQTRAEDFHRVFCLFIHRVMLTSRRTRSLHHKNPIIMMFGVKVTSGGGSHPGGCVPK